MWRRCTAPAWAASPWAIWRRGNGACSVRTRSPPSGCDPVDLDKLKAKIHALSAKTVANGCTEAEALAAAAKVAALLDQYDLSLSDVQRSHEQCDRLVIAGGKKQRSPMEGCIGAIAVFCDCKVWRQKDAEGRSATVFFGLPADLEMARTLYALIDAAMRTGAEAYKRSRKVISYRHDEGRSFLIGMAQAIGEALLEMKEDRDRANRNASGRDLVVVKTGVVEAEFSRLNLAFKQSGPSGRRIVAGAFESGLEAGGRFDLPGGKGGYRV
ncbi:MAG: DUF2786 domain-containing protein [Magnetospirillum sp.]|nr:DUF2786 domain-containing protein [Magnetospirillum sp.]